CDAELAERQAELEFVRGDLPHIEAQLGELRARLAQLDQARSRARERRRRLGPELDRARDLDGRIAATAAERERVLAKQSSARAQLAVGEAQLGELDRSLTQASARLDAVEAALAAQAGLE